MKITLNDKTVDVRWTPRGVVVDGDEKLAPVVLLFVTDAHDWPIAVAPPPDAQPRDDGSFPVGPTSDFDVERRPPANETELAFRVIAFAAENGARADLRS